MFDFLRNTQIMTMLYAIFTLAIMLKKHYYAFENNNDHMQNSTEICSEKMVNVIQ